MSAAPLKPSKWAQFSENELVDLMHRHYPLLPDETIFCMSLETVHKLLDAKAEQ